MSVVKKRKRRKKSSGGLNIRKILDTIEDGVDLANRIKRVANKIKKLDRSAESESTHPAQKVAAGEEHKVVQFPIKNSDPFAWLRKYKQQLNSAKAETTDKVT